jgi:hypothetical protein
VTIKNTSTRAPTRSEESHVDACIPSR